MKSNTKLSFILFSYCLISCAVGNLVWETPGNLQPVHGLYVKPSIDGTTGDLYVAATEDNGINSQWLTDQPINFLAATQAQQNTEPLLTSSLSTLSSPKEETVTTQKRAVLTTPSLKYSYSLPAVDEEASLPTTTAEESNKTPCSLNPTIPQYSPLPYFYPHMLSAIASALNTYKEPGKNEEGKLGTVPPPAWSRAYTYPLQYVVLDPSLWANPTAASSSALGKESS